MPEPSAAPTVPTRIGRYEVRKELGRGTMGVVYEAHDPALGRTIALKTIQVPFAASAREREDFERRFLAEARIAAGLSHGGIVVVHDVGRDAGHGILYIALEHLHGRTLAEVAADRRLSWRESLRIVGRVAEALGYAHAKGVVHRDIKPANIMLVGHGEPKIMDFGIAKLEAGDLTSTGQFFGTPLFMSPEQALSQPLDARTDLFSLGSVAYLLLTGRPPFEAASVPGVLSRVAYQHPKPLREAAPELPAEVEYIVARAMARNPADRYPDGRTMADDVEDVLAGRPPRHRGTWTPPETGAGTLASVRDDELPELSLEPVEERRPRRPRRRRIAVLVGLLAAVTAVYFYQHPADRKFWGRAAAEFRRSRIVEEVRAWWGRIGVESPEAPAAPVAAAPSTLAPAVATPAASPVALPSTEASAPPVEAPTQASDEQPEKPGSSEVSPIRPVAPPPAPAAAQAPLGDTSHAPAPLDDPGHNQVHLAIEFEHHLRHGTLQVWVDEQRVVREEFDGRLTRKILSFELRKGLVQQRLTLPPGRHDVRVEVRWDDNVKSARSSATFKAGASRKLEVHVSRIGGKLGLDWE